ncbi:SPOR domain-containing protein [Dyella marensis]|uniref:Cell division protein DedD (Protein involved in septation) n=1 Tax=Dyella marensis TaxID=500610 RepID=A0A1I1YB25_9GAMM|nr:MULTISPECIES: SPOR domain-containing protein [Dyella]SFE16807.1 Cell division protein DedD (protein involved in septation) [Dyella marensis]
MKTRLLGAAVLIALAVLFVPMFFSSTPPSTGGDETVSLAIPPAPDRDLQTRTMSLTPGAAPAGTAAAPTPASSAAGQAATPAGSDRLATVDIGSNRPRDVETDPAAGQQPAPTTVTRPGAPGQPVIPNQAQTQPPKPTTPAIADQSKPAQPKPAATTPAPVADLPAATAAHGRFTLNLSAYASTASAQNLLQRVRSLGYPVASRPLNQGGKQLTLVTAGPFDTRAAAEAARLKITQTIPGVPARLEGSAGTPAQDDAPAQAAAAPAAKPAAAPATPARAGGWAVQVAAMGSQADANALRDKLRASGFDGYVDTVNASGKQLWRVRAGPQTQRDDALRVRDQIKTKLGLAGNVVSAP